MGLLELGLIGGNKVKNQVGVPDWIRKNNSFSTACIKGLFDADGCIYFHKRKKEGTKTIELNFSNKSKPLIDFFVNFCNSYNIKTGGNYKNGGSEVFIYSRKNVIKFAQLVNSEKIRIFLAHNKLTERHLGTSLKL